MSSLRLIDRVFKKAVLKGLAPLRDGQIAFQDPFATGTVDRFSPQQLVHYSFEALQAWAYERGCTHSDEQTPLEFATQVASTSKQIGKPAKTLASLYNQAAYAPGSLSHEAVEHVRLLWKAFYRS